MRAQRRSPTSPDSSRAARCWRAGFSKHLSRLIALNRESTACPHVHLYPQNAKSPGLARPHGGYAQNCTSDRPPPSPREKIPHSSGLRDGLDRPHALLMRRNEALTSIGRARKFGGRDQQKSSSSVFSVDGSIGVRRRSENDGREPKTTREGRGTAAHATQRSDRRVARHTEPGRLGGVHRERDALEEADPRRSRVGAEGEGPPLPPADAVEEGHREAREGLSRVVLRG